MKYEIGERVIAWNPINYSILYEGWIIFYNDGLLGNNILAITINKCLLEKQIDKLSWHNFELEHREEIVRVYGKYTYKHNLKKYNLMKKLIKTYLGNQYLARIIDIHHEMELLIKRNYYNISLRIVIRSLFRFTSFLYSNLVKILFKSFAWLIFGNIIRLIIGFRNELKYKDELNHAIENLDFHRTVALVSANDEELQKAKKERDDILEKIKDNKREINESSNQSIALLISIMSLIIALVSITKK
jgi:hypothetical protein